jgi:hypothetical protein
LSGLVSIAASAGTAGFAAGPTRPSILAGMTRRPRLSISASSAAASPSGAFGFGFGFVAGAGGGGASMAVSAGTAGAASGPNFARASPA